MLQKGAYWGGVDISGSPRALVAIDRHLLMLV